MKGIWLEQTGNEIPEDLTEIFRALGDKTRLQIIRLLFRGICTTKELAQEMQLSEAAISKHLSVLKNAGLVEKKTRRPLHELHLQNRAYRFYSIYLL